MVPTQQKPTGLDAIFQALYQGGQPRGQLSQAALPGLLDGLAIEQDKLAGLTPEQIQMLSALGQNTSGGNLG